MQGWLHHARHQTLSHLTPDGTGTEKTVSGTRSHGISPAVVSSLPGTVLQEHENRMPRFQALVTTERYNQMERTYFQNMFVAIFHQLQLHSSMVNLV